jgi:hypothetical protein
VTLKTRLALRSLFAGGSITGLAYEDAQCTQPITNCEDPQPITACRASGEATVVIPDIADAASCEALECNQHATRTGVGAYTAALEPEKCQEVVYTDDEYGNPSHNCGDDHDESDGVDETYAAICPCSCAGPDGSGGVGSFRWSTVGSGSCDQWSTDQWVCLVPQSFGNTPGSECGTVDNGGFPVVAGGDGVCCQSQDWGYDPNWTCPTQPTCAIVQESGSGEVSLGCSNDMEGFPIADVFVSTARSYEVTCDDDDKLIYKEYLMDDCAGDAVTPEYSGSWNKPQAGYEQLYNGVAGGECLAIEGDDFFVKVESIVGVCSDPETPEKTSGAALSAATLTVPILAAAVLAALQNP